MTYEPPQIAGDFAVVTATTPSDGSTWAADVTAGEHTWILDANGNKIGSVTTTGEVSVIPGTRRAHFYANGGDPAVPDCEYPVLTPETDPTPNIELADEAAVIAFLDMRYPSDTGNTWVASAKNPCVFEQTIIRFTEPDLQLEQGTPPCPEPFYENFNRGNGALGNGWLEEGSSSINVQNGMALYTGGGFNARRNAVQQVMSNDVDMTVYVDSDRDFSSFAQGLFYAYDFGTGGFFQSNNFGAWWEDAFFDFVASNQGGDPGFDGSAFPPARLDYRAK